MTTRPTHAELEAEIARLRKLAYTDELTGLYNRHGFRELTATFMREALASRRGHRKSIVISDLSVVLFDLDRFKAVNDTYGHDAGDKALVAFGRLVRESVRDIDVAARWGGEEIVLALVGASEDDAARIAEGLRAKLEKSRVTYARKRLPLTVSAGVASMGDAASLDELVRRADRALYAAKHGGRNRVERWKAGL